MNKAKTLAVQFAESRELRSWSSEQLRQELAQAVTVTARTLRYLADIWRELSRRGEDLSDLRTGLGTYLPMIAAGQLDAEVVVKFAGQRTLLRAVSMLTIDEQHRVVTGAELPVLSLEADGAIRENTVAATLLTVAQAKLVFDEGRIRSIGEQRQILASARLAALRRPRPSRGPMPIEDPGRSAASRSTRVAVGDVIASLAAAASSVGEVPPADCKPIAFYVTAAERDALKSVAAGAGISVDRLIRMVLTKAGVLGDP